MRPDDLFRRGTPPPSKYEEYGSEKPKAAIFRNEFGREGFVGKIRTTSELVVCTSPRRAHYWLNP